MTFAQQIDCYMFHRHHMVRRGEYKRTGTARMLLYGAGRCELWVWVDEANRKAVILQPAGSIEGDTVKPPDRTNYDPRVRAEELPRPGVPMLP